MTTSTVAAVSNSAEEEAYASLIDTIRNDVGGYPLFTTSLDGGNWSLYEDFRDALPASRRQHYNCRACRKFFDKFGGLVTISDSGETRSLLWNHETDAAFFRDAIRTLNARVSKARVTGVFLSSEPIWGMPENRSPKSSNSDGKWHHFHIKPTGLMIHRPSGLLTSEQVMAEKLQDFGTLSRALDEFPIDLVRQAHTYLTSGALYRSEKCIGVAKWLLDLHESRDATKHKLRRENLVWRAVALAAPGFAHVRSTMIGSLLIDLAAGKNFTEIKESFDSKLHPLQYQRPQAAPTDGQLAAAEAVVSKLASAGSLRRRYARLEEIIPHAIWVPKTNASGASDGGVFGHLRNSSKSKTIKLPAQTMTWDKFSWTVLPNAERIEFLTPRNHSNFFAFVTATDPDAPPILQWDREDRRNPVNWYLYNDGSFANHWGLSAGTFVDVTAIALQPSGWHETREHQGDGAYFLLAGAKDSGRHAGLALFPETLRAEYRSIRSAIEAYSRAGQLDGHDEASACGIAFQKSSNMWNDTFRVTSKGAQISYRLDRWD
jgi:hypothetical protein